MTTDEITSFLYHIKTGDSNVQIIDVGLKDKALLHRFINSAGTPYSAIYCKGEECMSSERNGEARMLNAWEQYGQPLLYKQYRDKDLVGLATMLKKLKGIHIYQKY